jgi:PLD-like domain
MNDYEVVGANLQALFSLKLHRGEGMVLLAMNWRNGQPPDDFVGFAIEYQAPRAARFSALHNRLSFSPPDAPTNETFSSLRAPFQKFRWVHFPFDAEAAGEFTYRVTPLFMADDFSLVPGESQSAKIALARETYPGQLNVAFTRGFVSSQAFVDRYEAHGPVDTLVPTTPAKDGLTFIPTHPDAKRALPWMGFEARSALLELLDQAVADETTTIRAIAYDLNEPEIVDRFKALGTRLTIIIDNSKDHGSDDSAETQVAAILAGSAGPDHVKRQHMAGLQHNKTIIVDGPNLQKVICGSTNFSWRGLYVQNNNALILTGPSAITPFINAFNAYWADNHAAKFGHTNAATWNDLGLVGVAASVSFSPHSDHNAILADIGADIISATSSVFYSLAFLGQTTGPIRDAITQVTEREDIFVYGIADTRVGGIKIRTPDGNLTPVSPAQLNNQAPPPFRVEPSGGPGVRLHHKFVVIDADKPTARVYVGSYNFSNPADTKNGENLLLIRDRRVAVAYMVEAVRIFDHYEFRMKQLAAASGRTTLSLQKPPRDPGEVAWWMEDYTNQQKARDRLLFA